MRLTRAEFFRLLAAGFLTTPALSRAAGMQPKTESTGPDTPPITPTSRFYIEDIGGPPPPDTTDPSRWKLTLSGLVERPATWTYHSLLQRATTEHIITLNCIGNPVGGYAIGNARWKGVSLRALIAEVRPRSSCRFLLLKGLDGYHECLPLESIDQEGSILATHMNGAPLNRAHGFPARILVPGLYGIKQVKWIQEIRFVEQEETGYWHERGWSQTGRVQVVSRIDFPQHEQWLPRGHYEVRGIAFAGDRGIEYVQVSTDGEETWELAQLASPLSPWSWVFWKFPISFQRPGRYALSVRAVDQYSRRQAGDRRDPFPEGVTGFHRVEVRVY